MTKIRTKKASRSRETPTPKDCVTAFYNFFLSLITFKMRTNLVSFMSLYKRAARKPPLTCVLANYVLSKSRLNGMVASKSIKNHVFKYYLAIFFLSVSNFISLSM